MVPVGLARSDQFVPRIFVDERDEIVTRDHVQQALLEVLQPSGGWQAGITGGSCHGYINIRYMIYYKYIYMYIILYINIILSDITGGFLDVKGHY